MTGNLKVNESYQERFKEFGLGFGDWDELINSILREKKCIKTKVSYKNNSSSSKNLCI